MITIGNKKEVSEIRAGKKIVLYVYKGTKLIWEYIKSNLFSKDGYYFQSKDGYIINSKD